MMQSNTTKYIALLLLISSVIVIFTSFFIVFSVHPSNSSTLIHSFIIRPPTCPGGATNLSFKESGLPSGHTWVITSAGSNHSSTKTSFWFCSTSTSFTVPKLSNSSPGAITIYTPSPTSGTGSSTPTTITYSSATTSMSLYLNGVKNANNSINYGTESNFTAIISPSTDKVSLYVNGNEVVTLTSGKAIYLHTLAGGTYKVTASTDVSGVSNLTYYEKVNQSAPSLYLNGVNANTSINYGTESNFTAVAYSSSYFVSIYLNGTQIESLTKGSVTYLKILSAGFYNVTVVTNATGEPNVTYYERISKAAPTLTITDKPGNFTYNGTKDNSSALITTLNNQLSASLYINGKPVSATNTRASYLNASAGTYLAVFNTTGNQNYSSGSVHVNSTISKANNNLVLYINGLKDSNTSITYGTQSNFTASFEQDRNSTLPVNESAFKSITVGTDPYGVGYDSANNLIYVTNDVSSTVSVINPSNESSFKSITIGTYPYGVGYDSANNLIYVTNAGPGTVSVINPANESAFKNITVGSKPYEVGYDSANNLIYVANAGSGTVSVINPSNESSFKSITIGTYPYGVGYDSANNLIYVTNEGSGTVSVINPANESAFKNIIVGTDPQGVGYDSANNLIYVANAGSGTVSVINPAYQIQLYVNSTLKVTSEYKSAYYNPTLAAGLYKITAVSNVNSVNVTYYERINKATPVLTLASTPSQNYTQNGTSLIFHFSISTINNQLPADFYINGTLKNSSITTSGTYNAGDLTNIFNSVFNTTGNQNYTSSSASLSRQIYAIAHAIALELYLNGLKDSNTSITYGTQSNFTAQISNDYAEIYVNGTKVEPLTKNSVSYLKLIAAGLYKVTASTNVSGVSNVTYYEKISKATPTMAVTDVPGNFTYNGTKDNSSALITTINSQLSASLYINGKPVSATNTRASYLNASAGTYLAVFNTTGNQNYSSYSVQTKSIISKAVLSQTLKAYPSSSFIYDGKVPTIQDTLNKSIVPGNSLSFDLENNSVAVVSTASSSEPFNFTALPGKYAAAGSYSYSSAATSNNNYTILSSAALPVSISKATPTMAVTDVPGNFTYNGTKDNSSALITTINSQLSASLYINGKLVSATNTRASYLNASAGTYLAVFNTTGNQNYTSFSTSKIIRILTPSIILSLFISGKTNNSSITYGTVSDFVVTSQNSFVSLYINGTLVTKLLKDNLTYLNILPAGYWKITAVSNSSNENVTLYQNISKAIPKMSLFATPGNFVYNGSAEEFMGNISTINNQIYVKIYINGIPKAVSNSDIFYSLSSAGSYTAELITNGNNNYTAKKISTLITISKAKPILYIKIPNNYTYTGESSVVYYSIFSINNQLTANVSLNDLRVNTINSAGKTYEINPGIYTFNISTTGNSNYTSVYLVKSYSIYKIKPVLINSNLISFNSSVLKVVLNESQISANSFLVKINKYTPGTLIVNLGSGISNLVGLSSLNLETNASASNQNLTINHLANTTCLGNSLKKPITFFSVIPSFNETTEKASAAYFFNISKNQLSNSSLSVQNISLYRCSPGDGWVELPTYLVKSINGTYYYKAYSDSLSLYAIAQGFAYNAENLSNFTNEFIDEIGLPLNYTWIATYNGLNQTQKAGLPMLFSNPYENYPAVFYNFSNSSSNITVSCTTVYYPTNVKASEPIIIPNGLSFTVHYSDLTSCEPIITAPIIILTNTEVMFLALLFSVIMLLFIFISSMSFIKRKTK